MRNQSKQLFSISFHIRIRLFPHVVHLIARILLQASRGYSVLLETKN